MPYLLKKSGFVHFFKRHMFYRGESEVDFHLYF